MPLSDFIRRVLSSGLLTPTLVCVPSSGANNSDLSQANLTDDLRELLEWRNGLDLDVIRVHGFGEVEPGITPAVIHANGLLEFASDPAGFRYLLGDDGSVSSMDHDGGAIEKVTDSVDSFFRTFIFGNRAAEFAGADWAHDVAECLGQA